MRYKYVFVVCSTTNLERVCGLSKVVPRGKYFVCDERQKRLIEMVQQHWGGYSPLYRNIKLVTYGDNLLPKLQERGCLMMVRNNPRFESIIRQFDPQDSIILYSMWDGYRTKEGSTFPAFLSLTAQWEILHTSGHASIQDIRTVIEKTNAKMVIPIHTEHPELLKALCPERRIVLFDDGEAISI